MVKQQVPVQSFVVESPVSVELGVPRARPEALIERLTSGLGALAHIEGAWLALAHWPMEGQSSWFLTVRTSDANRTPVDAALQAALSGFEFDRPMDVLIDQPGQKEGIGIIIVEKSGPSEGLLPTLRRPPAPDP